MISHDEVREPENKRKAPFGSDTRKASAFVPASRNLFSSPGDDQAQGSPSARNDRSIEEGEAARRREPL